MSVRVKNLSHSFVIITLRPIDVLGLSYSSPSTKIDLPEWIRGKWLTIGTNAINSQTVEINTSQLIIKSSVDQTIVHDLKLTKMIANRRTHDHILRFKGKSLEQWSERKVFEWTDRMTDFLLVHRSSLVLNSLIDRPSELISPSVNIHWSHRDDISPNLFVLSRHWWTWLQRWSHSLYSLQ